MAEKSSVITLEKTIRLIEDFRVELEGDDISSIASGGRVLYAATDHDIFTIYGGEVVSQKRFHFGNQYFSGKNDDNIGFYIQSLAARGSALSVAINKFRYEQMQRPLARLVRGEDGKRKIIPYRTEDESVSESAGSELVTFGSKRCAYLELEEELGHLVYCGTTLIAEADSNSLFFFDRGEISEQNFDGFISALGADNKFIYLALDEMFLILKNGNVVASYDMESSVYSIEPCGDFIILGTEHGLGLLNKGKIDIIPGTEDLDAISTMAFDGQHLYIPEYEEIVAYKVESALTRKR